MAAGFKVVGMDGKADDDDQLVFHPFSSPSNDNACAFGDVMLLNDALGGADGFEGEPGLGAVLFTLGDLTADFGDVSEGLRVAYDNAADDAVAEFEAFGSGVMFVLGDSFGEA